MPENRTGLGPQSPERCEGKVNLPGIRTDVYVISRRDIAKWPVLPDTYTTGMGELAVYTGNFELAVNKTWRKLSVPVDKSPVTSESQGSKSSKTTPVKAAFVHPGTEEEATAFCRLANNGDYVCLVRTKRGKYRVIGNEMYRTETNPSQNPGGGPTDETGTTLEVSVTGMMPAPFYTDVMETAMGKINRPDEPSDLPE